MNRLKQLPPGFWVVLALVAGGAVLVFRWWVVDNRDGDASYLDADQPPQAVDVVAVGIRARQRLYPDNLRVWPHSPVGDC